MEGALARLATALDLPGGFAGLNVARGLGGVPIDVTLIDRHNYHLFQPLLYQVATAGLSAPQVASPIRHILRKQRNVRVILGEVVGIDAVGRRVALQDGELSFDYLVVAAGLTNSYFGHDEWSRHAPGLKTLEDALEIRRRVRDFGNSAWQLGSSTRMIRCLMRSRSSATRNSVVRWSPSSWSLGGT